MNSKHIVDDDNKSLTITRGENFCPFGLFCDKYYEHSYDILGARMLWKPKEARILKNFIDQPV